MVVTDLLTRAEAIVSGLKRDPGLVSGEDVVFALEVLPAYFLQTRCSVYMKGVRGAPDWLEHESLTWELSELVRLWLKARRSSIERDGVLDAVAHLVRNERHAKGRQNFVLLLGECGGVRYGETLALLLGDPNVAGHAVKALMKSQTPGYTAQVQKVLSKAKAAWVKTAARKYLALVNKEPME